jgi:hypothetical protein
VKQKDNCVNGIVQKQLELAKRVNKNAIFHMIYVEGKNTEAGDCIHCKNRVLRKMDRFYTIAASRNDVI